MADSADSPGDVTHLLVRAARGEKQASDELLPLVYNELRTRARRAMRSRRNGDTLQPTALVHEAYLRLVDQRNQAWEGRTHFFAVAAMTMRRVLIDHIRQRQRAKRGGEAVRVTLTGANIPGAEPDTDALALAEALERLANVSERQARVVELRFFGDLSVDETAEVLGVSRRTVELDWTFAKAWLKVEMTRGAEP
jgi:RNA polymerase sigma factor (TIGR02999 family)